MDYYQAIDTFKQMYPGKAVTASFDNSCIRQMEIIHTDGKANPAHHVEYQKVKISVEGQNPVYVPIMPHREVWDLGKVKDHIASISPL